MISEKTKHIKVGDVEYKVTIKTLGTTDAIDIGQPLFESAGYGVEDLLSQRGAQAVGNIITNFINTQSFSEYIKKMFDCSKLEIDDNRIEFKDKANDYYYDSFFSDNLVLLSEVVAYIAEVNYKDFFIGLAEKIKKYLGKKEEEEKEETTTEKD